MAFLTFNICLVLEICSLMEVKEVTATEGEVTATEGLVTVI